MIPNEPSGLFNLRRRCSTETETGFLIYPPLACIIHTRPAIFRRDIRLPRLFLLAGGADVSVGSIKIPSHRECSQFRWEKKISPPTRKKRMNVFSVDAEAARCLGKRGRRSAKEKSHRAV